MAGDGLTFTVGEGIGEWKRSRHGLWKRARRNCKRVCAKKAREFDEGKEKEKLSDSDVSESD